MIDMILNPPAVVRKLTFPSPLIQNGEGGNETKKTICKRKRKLINLAQTKPVRCNYTIFLKFVYNVTYRMTRSLRLSSLLKPLPSPTWCVNILSFLF